ncbi:MAG: adenylosuccinate synthase [FCB group bacterium]|nr:adenylosuccinate synthase [FCB group bacterium]MBL7026916.1 adenylosuccinate synthase [Candidatus Neomarinimicrobiota bacterium]MBL7120467.1 adenylosuccinate synthase [Candidatus Neomarinimicrobiota bacterium]
MKNTIVVGAQWGDEGKGKLVDVLAEQSDLVVRFNGGGNAGHTVMHAGETYKFHYMPSGMLHNKQCILGTGVVINPKDLLEEIKSFTDSGHAPKLQISARAHVIFPHHQLIDAKEGGKIGTTGRGIGPTYSQKASRINLRILDIIADDAIDRIKKSLRDVRDILVTDGIFSESEFKDYCESVSQEYASFGSDFKEYVTDTEDLVRIASNSGKQVLFEGAQGTLLDLNYGTYPFVTSSSTLAAAAFVGGGAIPGVPIRILGITKAYTTRVGEGPFPTELDGDAATNLREAGHEYGATTGRPRRVGHLDLYALRYAIRISGIQELAMTKIDTLALVNGIKACTGYKINGKGIDYFPADAPTLELVEPIYTDIPYIADLSKDEWAKLQGKSKADLPESIQTYIKFIEDFVEIPITILSHGPERNETIVF